MKPGRPPRVVPSKVPIITQESINHMKPKIRTATHNTAKNIEYEPLPWYLIDTVIDPVTGEILH